MNDEGLDTAVDRLSEMLDLIAAEGSHAYAKCVIEDVRIPRSSAYQLLTRLIHAGYLKRLPCGGLRLGDEISALALSRLSLANAADAIRDTLRMLQEETQELAYLACLHDNRVIVTHLFRSERAARTVISVGAEFPVNWLACGRLLLSHLSDDQLKQFLISNVRPSPNCDATTNLRKLTEEVHEARRKRYVVELPPKVGGTGSIAAAVVAPSGACVAAISLTLPGVRMIHNVDSLVSCVCSAATALTAVLTQPGNGLSA
jgi:DNA-binding IclR family transcriptional regulator